MLRNYLKIAVRNMLWHKLYSFINIIGLAAGLACCMLILLWVQDELSYDRFHEKADNIYRLVGEEKLQDRNDYFAQMSAPLGPAIRANIPEAVHVTRYEDVGTMLMRSGDEEAMEVGVTLVDPEFFDIFSFPFLMGNARAALAASNAMVITRKTAQLHFGDANPLGRVLTLDNRHDMVVTGVIENIPANSHIQFDCLGRFDIIERIYDREPGQILDAWESYGYSIYIQLHPQSSPATVGPKVAEIVRSHSPENEFAFHLQPLKDIYLRSSYISYRIGDSGDIRFVYIFSLIAAFVLVIACINFTSLATARAVQRAKEVGIRKTVGASRARLFGQFLGESFFMTLLAALLALAIAEIALPLFRGISGKTVMLDPLANWQIPAGLVLIVFATGTLAGLYPAVYLSSFRPLNVLKGRLHGRGIPVHLRRILVMIQFVITIFLIVCTLIMSDQIEFMRNKKLGYDKDHIVYVGMRGDLLAHQEAARQELLNYAGISQVTISSNRPTYGIRFSTSSLDWAGKNQDEDYLLNFVIVDHAYLDAFAMEMAAGRFFSPDMAMDSSAIVLNETAVRAFGLDEPLGKQLTFGPNEATIIGVVRDYFYKSLHTKIEPLAMIVDPEWSRFIMMKINNENIPATMAHIETIWKKYAPEYPFECHFLDEDFDALYRREHRMETIFTYFAALAIGIACLGLFGLSSFMTGRRAREISIRKVMGASVGGVVALLSKEFIILVAVANIVAWPIAWYAMRQWLSNFAYRTDITITTFLAAAGAAMVITIATVSFLSIKAALADPVEALRHE